MTRLNTHPPLCLTKCTEVGYTPVTLMAARSDCVRDVLSIVTTTLPEAQTAVRIERGGRGEDGKKKKKKKLFKSNSSISINAGRYALNAHQTFGVIYGSP